MIGAEHALRSVEDGHVVGLGTGHAATAFVRALAERVRAGLRIAGVPTSDATARLARELGIPLVSLAERPVVDVAVDGADEVDPRLDLVKGWGGALLREKIVAAAARRFVVLVGTEKLVPMLGSRGKLPVEVVPFGAAVCGTRLERLGLRPTRRGGEAIPAVVATGLFLGMADVVVVDAEGRIETRVR